MTRESVSIKWTGDLQFIGTDSGNHSIVISAHSETNHTGMKPSELLLLSLGSCSMYDIVVILGKKKIELSRLEVDIRSQQAVDPPHTFETIHLHYMVSGKQITKKAVEQAIDLSLSKYCSVAATIRGVANIEHSFEIIDGGLQEEYQKQVN